MLYSLCVFKGFLINHLNFVKFGDHKKRKIHVYFLQVSCMCYYVILFSSRIAQKPAIIIVVVVVDGILYGIPITTFSHLSRFTKFHHIKKQQAATLFLF